MKRYTAATFLLVLIQLVTSLPVARAAEGFGVSRLTFTTSLRACIGTNVNTLVFDTSVAEIHVILALPYTDEAKVTFTWTDPDGNVAATNRRLGFREAGADELYVWDVIRPSSKVGWWSVEARTEDEYLSKSFLMTDNRQVWTLVNGDRTARLGVVRDADTTLAEGADVVRVGAVDRLPEVRAAAARRLGEVDAAWAASLARDMQRDPNPAVRIAAVESGSGLDESERLSVYLGVMNSEDVSVRRTAIAGLVSIKDKASDEGLARALHDTDARIRRAALSELISRGSGLYPERLPELVRDPDRTVAGLALDESIGLDGGDDLKVRSLLAATSGAYEDYSLRALDVLAGLNDERALDVYMRYFRAGHDMPGMLAAVTAVEGPAPIEPLYEIYRSSVRDADMRLAAVKALAGRGNGTEAALYEALRDRYMKIRLAAVDAAAEIEDPAVRGRVLAAALVPGMQLEVRRKALGYLTERVDPALTPYVLDAMDDEDLRGAALEHAARDTSYDSLRLLAEKARKIPDDGFRARAVSALVDAGADDSVLMDFVPDGSDEVKRELVRGLSKIDGPLATKGLLLAGVSGEAGLVSDVMKGLDGRPAADLNEAVEMVFRDGLPAPKALSFIAEALPDASLLEDLLGRISRYDCERVGAALYPMIKRAKPYDAPALLDSLGYCRNKFDKEVIKALSRVEGDGEGALLLEAYYRAPGMWRDILAAAGTSDRKALVVPEAAGSGDPDVRAVAMELVPGLGAEDASRIITAGLSDKDEHVRLIAARVAASLGMEQELAAAAGSPDTGTRLAALSGLGALRTKTAYNEIGAMLADPDRVVAGTALEILSSAGGDVPTGAWKAALEDNGLSEAAVLAAVKSLSASPQPGYAPVFAGMLKGRGREVREAAADGLVAIGGPSLEHVYPLLGSPETFGPALDVVERVADPSSVGVLRGLLGPDSARSLAVVAALGRVGGPDAVDALLYAAGLDGVDMRLAVLKSLAMAGADPGDARVAGLVSGALDSPDDSLRFYGAHAAGEIGLESLRGRLETMAAEDPSALVRRQAGVALGELSPVSSP